MQPAGRWLSGIWDRPNNVVLQFVDHRAVRSVGVRFECWSIDVLGEEPNGPVPQQHLCSARVCRVDQRVTVVRLFVPESTVDSVRVDVVANGRHVEPPSGVTASTARPCPTIMPTRSQVLLGSVISDVEIRLLADHDRLACPIGHVSDSRGISFGIIGNDHAVVIRTSVAGPSRWGRTASRCTATVVGTVDSNVIHQLVFDFRRCSQTLRGAVRALRSGRWQRAGRAVQAGNSQGIRHGPVAIRPVGLHGPVGIVVSDLPSRGPLLHVGENPREPTRTTITVGVGIQVARWERLIGVVVVVQSDAELLQVVLTLRPPGGFPGLLNSRQQQSDENGDDRNDNEQFDQRKSVSSVSNHKKCSEKNVQQLSAKFGVF